MCHGGILGHLNLPYADWNGNAGVNRGTQALVNSFVWENDYNHVMDFPTQKGCITGCLPGPTRALSHL